MRGRSFGILHNVRNQLLFPETFPEDWETVKLCYPFIEANRARNVFRLAKQQPGPHTDEDDLSPETVESA